MLEKKFQKKLTAFMIKHGIDYYHEPPNIGGRRTKNKGWPDLFIFLPNAVTVFIELKSDTGRTKKHQTEKHNRLRALGFKVITAKPDDLELIIGQITYNKFKG
jgi:hypothetical protein